MENLTSIEIIYWIATIVGGTLFILRTIFMLVGGGVGDEALDTALDVDLSGEAADHGADISFQLLSVQGLTSFFMMFGLVGLALLKANLAVALTIAGGVAAGLVSVWITGLLFSQMKRLQSDGTLNVRNAIGRQGSVYLTIAAGKSGQVQVAVQGSLRIFDAVSKSGKKIATGEKIKIVDVVDTDTLVVEKID
jgi:membrane protein implicated in regulation of membrane protease activity